MISPKRCTVLVAMSGGVDSSVAAALLHEQGHEVIGATLKLWCYEERQPAERACCSQDAIRDARSVAVSLGFSHYVLDYTELFRKRVAEPFMQEYLAGRTPYPCAACNSDLKFGRLLEQAREIGAEYVATGHYVRRREYSNGDRSETGLSRACHGDKDQTYALWAVSPRALPHLLFPLGELTKGEVRSHARRLGFAHLTEKLESQDLCFVGASGDHTEYIAEELGRDRVDRPGPVLDLDGRQVGVHKGLAHYTVGQRRGLGVSGVSDPLYVVALEPEGNALLVGPSDAISNSVAPLSAVNWLLSSPPVAGQRVQAQIRYKQTPHPARLFPRDSEVERGTPLDLSDGLRVVFDRPQRAVTPGQSAVFYDGDRLLGGGTIERS